MDITQAKKSYQTLMSNDDAKNRVMCLQPIDLKEALVSLFSQDIANRIDGIYKRSDVPHQRKSIQDLYDQIAERRLDVETARMIVQKYDVKTQPYNNIAKFMNEVSSEKRWQYSFNQNRAYTTSTF